MIAELNNFSSLFYATVWEIDFAEANLDTQELTWTGRQADNRIEEIAWKSSTCGGKVRGNNPMQVSELEIK